ncbi:syndecan-3 [Crotalus adamanteus]|uniref:Syndecan n=1 Tax=Crotalus adamanteus TaxID=8729 RepID=A0AAW1AY66_CROAD
MEGSGDDYSFEDEELEEMEDFYSGSGSGYFKQDPESKTVVRLTTDSPILLATTSAVLPVRDTAQLSTSQEPDVTTMPQPPTATPTDAAQAEPMETSLPTVTVNELEVPISGDFEIHEEEVAQTELGNEVVPLVTPAAGPGLKKKMEPGLLDNTIESGNSAAQLPQKNILERKEVLIAVIVGGVVGALFATFLVMLLIYRMKKKDEGSYTLEEPKQASVTYQKPDKQEEFYA